jgi:hypothetical protein
VVDLVTTGTAIATWLAGRSSISGSSALDEEANNLLRTKNHIIEQETDTPDTG